MKSNMMKLIISAISAGVVGTIISYYFLFRNKKPKLPNQKIILIEKPSDWKSITQKIKLACEKYPVIGFDCEWITISKFRNPVALIQIATVDGLCALFRTVALTELDPELIKILENGDIFKVGVIPLEDASFLAIDFDVHVMGTLDLRYMLDDHKCDGLGKMAKEFLNYEMDKYWRIRCSNWENELLTARQLKYAADDAQVAIEIFKKLIQRYCLRNKVDFQTALINYRKFMDIKFRVKQIKTGGQRNIPVGRQPKTFDPTKYARASPLYQNCNLVAPDGELLCTCDRKKAEWYVYKNLGTVVSDQPYTVRLNFEPAGRAVGDVGEFYKIEKLNRCVVCGADDVYQRKNIIPREYRKHFPAILKDHTSHDILLLCPLCHQRSNILDARLRKKLDDKCGLKSTPNEELKLKQYNFMRIKSIAKALMNSKNKIPIDRLEKLKAEFLERYQQHEEKSISLITKELLIDVLNSNMDLSNPDDHGKNVVEYFQNHNNQNCGVSGSSNSNSTSTENGNSGGLIELERIWRTHFLDTMKPKFLPKLWSINHNSQRLEIRVEENRVSNDELQQTGFKSPN